MGYRMVDEAKIIPKKTIVAVSSPLANTSGESIVSSQSTFDKTMLPCLFSQQPYAAEKCCPGTENTRSRHPQARVHRRRQFQELLCVNFIVKIKLEQELK